MKGSGEDRGPALRGGQLLRSFDEGAQKHGDGAERLGGGNRLGVRTGDGERRLSRMAGASGDGVVQRHVLYLGEINDSRELAWRKSIEAIEERAPRARTLSLFPEDRCEGLIDNGSIVRLKLKEMRLCRPRTFGSSWLALTLWRELELDRFWKDRLPASREGTRWDEVLFVLVAYRLLSPGSEWRLHREWFDRSALADQH